MGFGIAGLTCRESYIQRYRNQITGNLNVKTRKISNRNRATRGTDTGDTTHLVSEDPCRREASLEIQPCHKMGIYGDKLLVIDSAALKGN